MCGSHRLSKAAVKDRRLLPMIRNSPGLRGLVERSYVLIDTCRRTELCNILNGISKLRYPLDKSWLDKARDRAMRIMVTFDSQSFSNTVNAFGRLAYQPGDAFWDRFFNLSQPQLPTFNSLEMASLCNGFGWLGVVPPQDYLQTVLDQVHERMPHLKPQEFANVLNGLNKMRVHPGEEFLQHFVGNSTGVLPRFTNQDLSCVVNAFGHMGFWPGEEFMRVFTDCVMQKMPTFNSQDFGNVINAYAKLCPPWTASGWDPCQHRPEFFERFLHYSSGKLDTFNAQELANTINALAKFSGSVDMPDTYLAELTRAAILPNGQLKNFIPQAYAMMIHGYGKFSYYPGQAFTLMALEKVLRVVLEKPLSFTPQGLALILNGLANFKFHPGSFFLETLTAALMSRSDKLDWQNMSNMLNAFVVFRHRPEDDFWQSLHDIVARHAGSANTFEVAAVLYCFAAMDGPGPPSTLPLLLERACNLMEEIMQLTLEEHQLVDSETGGAYRQLYQTYRYLFLLYRGRAVSPELRERFGSLAKRLWEFVQPKLKTSIRTSEFQKEVEDMALRPLGMDFEDEVMDGPFMLDFVVHPQVAGVLPVVIEVDGPSHFYVNREEEPTGTSEFKYRLLEAHRKNWAGLVCINGIEWYRSGIRKNPEMCIDLLRAKFAEAGIDINDYLPQQQHDTQGGPTLGARRRVVRKAAAAAAPSAAGETSGDADVRHADDDHAPAASTPADADLAELLQSLLLNDLKALCEKAGLKKSGRKQELVTRLLEVEASSWMIALPPPSSGGSSTTRSRARRGKGASAP